MSIWTNFNHLKTFLFYSSLLPFDLRCLWRKPNTQMAKHQEADVLEKKREREEERRADDFSVLFRLAILYIYFGKVPHKSHNSHGHLLVCK